MAEEMNAANRSAINTKGFELEAERMGQLMRDKYRIGFIDVGGWDTHVGEGAAQGTLANNLASLGRGLQAFSQSLGAEWNNTVVVVLIGVRPHLQGERQSRHGPRPWHGVLGARRRHQRRDGRRRAARRGPRRLLQDRDFPVLNDYRAVLGGMFRTLWGLSPGQSGRIFPQVPPKDLKLV
jgi:uncharacterized protein (DUF1501 family)